MSRGFVYLVGAGPGDPRLLTMRAYELLRAAEIVAHDELVSAEILALAAPDAERLAVGRRRGHGTATYRVHPLVLERARAGRTVVRLKAGDPFVFGRGGEEAEELAEEGIPFEIVPGVSAALGAAAYAGIPLTHREHASSVTFATGHRGAVANGGGETIVMFMASRALGENLAGLIARGVSPSTPAAYVASATTVRQRVVVGTIADLAVRIEGVDPEAPALVIAGDVVAVRERIAWFEARPLRGRRILVARARPGRSQIAAELRALGAEVREEPDVTVAPVDEIAAPRARDLDAVVFGCAAGVDALASRGIDFGLPAIAVGAAAIAALRRRGVAPSVAIDGACEDSLAAHEAHLRGRRLLLIAAEGGRPNLHDDLIALGASVEIVAAYRHVLRDAADRRPPIDLVILPSSSAARAVLAGAAGASLRDMPAVVIGPRTEAEARRLGVTHVVRAASDTTCSVVERAILELSAGGAP